ELQMAMLDDLQRHEELARLTRSVLRRPNGSIRSRAVAHYYAGRAALFTSPRQALYQARAARKLFEQIEDAGFAAEALDCAAAAMYMMQDPSALQVARDALAEYRQLQDRNPQVEARLLGNIASYLLQRGRHTEAIGTYREALDVGGAVLAIGR